MLRQAHRQSFNHIALFEKLLARESRDLRQSLISVMEFLEKVEQEAPLPIGSLRFVVLCGIRGRGTLRPGDRVVSSATSEAR